MNEELERISKSVRRRIFDFKTKSGVGHLATCLSTVDVLVSMYFDPNTDFDHTRDDIIFSKGHGSPAVYPILADLGYFPQQELDNYGKFGGLLRMHADQSIPGCHFVGGSLGNGLGYASGLAYGNRKNKVYVILGDGELYEGSIWESLMFISHYNLSNMKIIVDRNNLCILGSTEEIIKLEPLKKKFEAFGFSCKSINGHDFTQLRRSLSPRFSNNKPEIIIANTTKGKGVSYMEGKWRYHTIIPKEDDLIQRGMEELI